MTKDEIARLRAIAKAADGLEPGDWYSAYSFAKVTRAEPADDVTRDHVVAFSPITILALLDLIESQRAEIERERALRVEAIEHDSRTAAELAEATLTIARLTKERDEARIEGMEDAIGVADDAIDVMRDGDITTGNGMIRAIRERIAELRAGAGKESGE